MAHGRVPGNQHAAARRRPRHDTPHARDHGFKWRTRHDLRRPPVECTALSVETSTTDSMPTSTALPETRGLLTHAREFRPQQIEAGTGVLIQRTELRPRCKKGGAITSQLVFAPDLHRLPSAL